eukprot:1564755-Rhodomonas_salina.2
MDSQAPRPRQFHNTVDRNQSTKGSNCNGPAAVARRAISLSATRRRCSPQTPPSSPPQTTAPAAVSCVKRAAASLQDCNAKRYAPLGRRPGFRGRGGSCSCVHADCSNVHAGVSRQQSGNRASGDRART